MKAKKHHHEGSLIILKDLWQALYSVSNSIGLFVAAGKYSVFITEGFRADEKNLF